jgi:hypothetical protein
MPGAVLTVRIDGLSLGGFAVVRVSDSGGELVNVESTPEGRESTANGGTANGSVTVKGSGASVTSSNTGGWVMERKCAGQLYGAVDTPPKQHQQLHVITPCDNAPAELTVVVVGAGTGFGPFYLQSMTINRTNTGQRAASCPPPTPPTPPPYPFIYPLNASCPNGAAAQHRVPCPDIPCIAPPTMNGTCLVITSWPEQTTPERNGSIMAESRVELLTDAITPTSHHYVTGSFPPPRAWNRDMTGWTLQVDGEVQKNKSFTMEELQSQFKHVTRQYGSRLCTIDSAVLGLATP